MIRRHWLPVTHNSTIDIAMYFTINGSNFEAVTNSGVLAYGGQIMKQEAG